MKERDAISVHDKETIAKIRREYGKKIRAYREGGESPV